ncbi:DUF2063 domain-containing protein [Stagnimonas aquatica]|uniref:DUF2063 domain-containing protein n=1 Tax=Stagnimonas aquatica TaxID=2689987 RepID=A0A3N0V0T5_9GAMM|nr:putative DNA-binding domain-containing protein [Stagnimonas aquatica]ROH86426.1 DUF2063 domain-containing protein [Stagnimonas aquatica]
MAERVDGLRPRFQQLQYAFTAHLRDPEQHPGPAGIEERRLRVYRELFYNNVEGFLANAFPVIRQLLPDAHWHGLVRDFYARHQCRDPLFNGVAEEFVRYLQDERGTPPEDPAFLPELAHYEWVELALSIAEDAPHPDRAELGAGKVSLADPNGDLLAAPPYVSPLAWTLGYDYPVHRIGPQFQPGEPGAETTWLVVYRSRQDEVRFLEINAVTARLLSLAEEQPEASGAELIARIASELGTAATSLMAPGLAMLQGLREREVILGTRRPAPPAT